MNEGFRDKLMFASISNRLNDHTSVIENGFRLIAIGSRFIIHPLQTDSRRKIFNQ